MSTWQHNVKAAVLGEDGILEFKDELTKEDADLVIDAVKDDEKVRVVVSAGRCVYMRALLGCSHMSQPLPEARPLFNRLNQTFTYTP